MKIIVNGVKQTLTRELALEIAQSEAINAYINSHNIGTQADSLTVQAYSSVANAQAAVAQTFMMLYDRMSKPELRQPVVHLD